MVEQKQREVFSEHEDKRQNNKSNFNKSEQPKVNETSDVKIYFDDPTTFVHLEAKPKNNTNTPPEE